MAPHFRPYHFDDADFQHLSRYMHALYEEDIEGEEMTVSKVQKTVAHLRQHPSAGALTMIEVQDQVVGYGLTINYWSNEYGGNYVGIDELYIHPSFRSQGIGTRFFDYLRTEFLPDAVAFELQVMPENTRALQLYLRLGFQINDRLHLYFE